MRVLKYNQEHRDSPAQVPPPAVSDDRIIYLFHHCVAVEDELGQFGGWTDSPLTELGEGQAEKMYEFCIANGISFDRFFSSDLPRAAETAHYLIPLSKDKEVMFTAQARSWGIGTDISGQQKSNPVYKNLKRYYVQNPDDVPSGAGAESLNQSKYRWIQFLSYLWSLTKPGSPTGLVAHGNNIKNTAQGFGFGRLKVGHGAVCRLTLNDKGMDLDVLFIPEGSDIGAEDDDMRKTLAAGKSYRCLRK
jgi:broad specificity phosphatase PhoE